MSFVLDDIRSSPGAVVHAISPCSSDLAEAICQMSIEPGCSIVLTNNLRGRPHSTADELLHAAIVIRVAQDVGKYYVNTSSQ